MFWTRLHRGLLFEYDFLLTKLSTFSNISISKLFCPKYYCGTSPANFDVLDLLNCETSEARVTIFLKIVAYYKFDVVCLVISILYYIIRSQEKNLNQNRDSNLGPPDFLRSYNVNFPRHKLWVCFQSIFYEIPTITDIVCLLFLFIFIFFMSWIPPFSIYFLLLKTSSTYSKHNFSPKSEKSENRYCTKLEITILYSLIVFLDFSASMPLPD